MDLGLAGKMALVTGGSEGIGLERQKFDAWAILMPKGQL